MKIFVGGSLKNIERSEEICNQFVVRLGEVIMERGYVLLNGCRGTLDKKIAESAAVWLNDNEACRQQIHSYILEGEEDMKMHNVGSVFTSELKDWTLTSESLEVPEQIKCADVTIFIAGNEGTLIAGNWARIARKPILGIGMFGGSGKTINKAERRDFENRYAHLLNKDVSYNDLNQVTEDVDHLANIVVSFCENLRRSNSVFSIMSFKKEYNDVFRTYETICKKYEFNAVRTDHDPNLTPITGRIINGIRESDFVIADISELSPNVFYEIGYARGIDRTTILTAAEGTMLPFDIKDIPVIFYDRFNLTDTLVPALEKQIQNQRIALDS